MSIEQAKRMENAPLSGIRMILSQVEELNKQGKKVLSNVFRNLLVDIRH